MTGREFTKRPAFRLGPYFGVKGGGVSVGPSGGGVSPLALMDRAGATIQDRAGSTILTRT